MTKKPHSRVETGTGTAGAQDTRAALIRAATIQFGEHGFAGTSIRSIAAEAKVNLALISYHFGGKDGLYEACALNIADTLRQVVGTGLTAAAEQGKPIGPDEALAVLENAIRSLVGFIVANSQSRHFVMFVVRELSHPGRNLEIIFSQVFEPVHRAACRLYASAAGGDAEDPSVKLAVFSVVGQVIYFRLAMPIVQRRMGWAETSSGEAGEIEAQIVTNLRDCVHAARRRNGAGMTPTRNGPAS